METGWFPTQNIVFVTFSVVIFYGTPTPKNCLLRLELNNDYTASIHHILTGGQSSHDLKRIHRSGPESGNPLSHNECGWWNGMEHHLQQIQFFNDQFNGARRQQLFLVRPKASTSLLTLEAWNEVCAQCFHFTRRVFGGCTMNYKVFDKVFDGCTMYYKRS